jgi:hypothetical protein
MTQSMERAGISHRSFIGTVDVTAGGLLVARSPVLWQQARSDGFGFRRRNAK